MSSDIVIEPFNGKAEHPLSYHRILNKPNRIILSIIFFYLLVIGAKRDWIYPRTPIKFDVAGYYIYLPALIIYDDPTFQFVHSKQFQADYSKTHKYKFETWFLNPVESKNYSITKFSICIAILNAPFFLIAHSIALLSNDIPNGYSDIYGLFLILSNLFYFIVGLIYTKKNLSFFFPPHIVSWTLIILSLCTNILYYTSLQSGMSHVYLFGLFSVFLYYTIRWHSNFKPMYLLFLGFLLGLITIARPTNIIVALIPLLYGINTTRDVSSKIALFWKHKYSLLGALLLFFIAISPQLIFWKHTTDHWIYYSYQKEGFYFAKPAIFEGLLGFRKGWLVYTPIMIISFLGFIYLRKFNKDIFVSLLIFTILNIYIIFSWWCWWYGGTFGMRSMIESTAFLSFTVASFLYFFHNIKHSFIIFFTVCMITFFLNVFQSYQYNAGIIHPDGMTFSAYVKTFGKFKLTEEEKRNVTSSLDVPDYSKIER